MMINVPEFIRLPGPVARLMLCMGLTFGALSVHAQGDALDEPSTNSAFASSSLLMDLDRVGDSLVAVGERGYILTSDDGGESWSQAEVPVRVTLTACHFVNDKSGWAVGHDGVVLRTRDGGHSWQKVLDGYQANELMLARAQERVAELESALSRAEEDQQAELTSALDEAQYQLEDAESFNNEGPSRPLLDVWFSDVNEGYVIGAFGLFLRTQDGGDSWTAWFDHLDSPESLHLNAIRQAGDYLYIAAEAGNLFRSDDAGVSWQRLDSPYDGSFFGLISDSQGRLITYGLRGHAFRSDDAGDSWSAIDTGTDASLFGAALTADGNVVLAGATGTTVVIPEDGSKVRSSQTRQRRAVSALIGNGDAAMLTVGDGGVQTLSPDSDNVSGRF